jgi:hypothetical protein
MLGSLHGPRPDCLDTWNCIAYTYLYRHGIFPRGYLPRRIWYWVWNGSADAVYWRANCIEVRYIVQPLQRILAKT